MDDIKFEEASYIQPLTSQSGPKGLSGLVIRSGFAKDEKGAQKVLITVFVLCILALIYIWWPQGVTNVPDPTIY
ncbi:hypothetical protein COU19_00045 [Candidatus Kaiserbacteria bacterium CG10_big_fil_rev_8_21_14_0_10_56_12]|uniref:Uncharacterized protein n=1 Tax=Candidatus Kaiserbacteria bacterium CG10_big_fil_rev_8_21_14_0_10_56_12 TaxID=1974611 RepID=A0A2H0UAW7_9BACT|nr:MAG: hypothetical protein COU19_00045 [Candidatus Kaiserbacteria bacterium CG10_big_fil_rev_8_21_14_0_10_56_12]